jgi:hypothetical protein
MRLSGTSAAAGGAKELGIEMKRCPACDQTYADDALSFCINDGAALVGARPSEWDAQATMMAPPPSVTPPPPTSFSDPEPTDWSAPQYSPPADLNAPGAWVPPPAPGAWQQPSTPQGMPGMAQTRGPQPQQSLAIASLICGLLSVTFGLICGGPVMGVAAIVLGIVALVQIKNHPQRFGGKGLAIAGITLGVLWALFVIFWLLIFILGTVSR